MVGIPAPPWRGSTEILLAMRDQPELLIPVDTGKVSQSKAPLYFLLLNNLYFHSFDLIKVPKAFNPTNKLTYLKTFWVSMIYNPIFPLSQCVLHITITTSAVVCTAID